MVQATFIGRKTELQRLDEFLKEAAARQLQVKPALNLSFTTVSLGPFDNSVERFFTSLHFEQPRCPCTGVKRERVNYVLAWKGKTG